MFRTLLINSAFRLLDTFLISKLPDGTIKDYIKGQVAPLKRVAEAMTDNNPDNDAQLKQIWREENDGIVKETFDTAKVLVLDKVEDQDKAAIYVDLLEGLKLELLEVVEGNQR